MKKPLQLKIFIGALFLFSFSGLYSQTLSYSQSNVSCFGGADGSITITINGGTSSYKFHIYKTVEPSVCDSFGPTTDLSYTFDNLDYAWYTVYVRDLVSNSILGFNTFEITEPGQLDGTVSSTNITCFGSNNGTINISSPVGGHGTFEYRVTGRPWQSSGSFTALGPGTYTVEIRDAAYPSCSRTLDAARIISEPAELTATLNFTNITCYNANNGTITISAPTGGSGTYQYTINGGSTWQNTGNYTNLIPGNYNVRMRDAANPSCVKILNGGLVLTQPAQLNGGTITVEKPLTCWESTDGILRANPTGGTAPYTYLWYFDTPVPPTSYVSTGVTTSDYTVAERGGYRVRINDANNCGPVLSVTLSLIEGVNPNVPFPLSVSSTSTPACDGDSNGSITINGSGGWIPYNYFIINSTSDTTGPQGANSFNSVSTGVYEPWITDDKGCTKKGTDIAVGSMPPPTADAGADINRCDANPTAPLAMTGAVAGGTFTSATWTGGAAFGTWTQNANPALAIFTPTTTSGSFTATLTVTGSGACSGTNPADTRTISWGQSPTADAGADINRCDATPTAPVTMTGAVAGGTFTSATWTGGAAFGTWTQNANPALATFTPTTTSGSFTATLTVTGGGTCTGTNPTDTRTITWGQSPTADAGADINRCDATPTAPIAMTGAAAGGTFTSATWTGGAAFGTWTQNADPALATFTPTTTSGSFTATLTVTGLLGCTGTNPTDTRIISWGLSPTADAGADINRCDANPTAPVAMTGAVAGGTFTSATWTGGAAFGTWTQNADPALATFTPTTSSGSFTATLTVTGSLGCTGTNPTDTRTITWGQSPTANAGADINRCDANPTAPITMTGATAGGTITSAVWSGGAAFGTWTQNANPALATFTPTTTSGSFTATLTVTGSGACAGTNPTDTRTITWGQSPTADAGADINRCDATPTAPIAMSGAAAGGTFTSATWTGGAAFGTWTQNADPALATFTPTTTSGSFTATLTVTGSGACTGTNPADTRTITWGQSPTADAGADINRCDATPMAPIAMTGAVAGGTFTSATWTGGAAFGTWTQNANPALATFTPTTTSGSFTATLTVTGSGACTGTNPADTRTISWGQSPTAEAGADINRCDATPTAPVAMTGAAAGGTFTSATWTGGAAFGSWTQNADPALATFTPTTTSGSFTATLTVTGGGTCTGTNPTDTRTITWGQSPTADAGADINRCDATPTAPIAMTGAAAGGTFTSATWTGGAAFGTWTQNADPALATFTPTTTSGSFTATLTVTGSLGCTGTNPTDTRIISWGQSPTADAGADINRCDATPTAPIAMTGAAAGGTITSATWTGGAAFGTWTQNADPALATFTPTTSSGSFTATLTVTGSHGCTGTNPTDTRTITWGQSPTANAGADINRCDANPTAPIAMTGAVAGGTFTSSTWTGGAAFGTWTQNANPALATFTPTTTSGSFTATLTVTGSGACSGTNPTDTRTITWGQSPTADAGADINRCDATPMAPIAMTGAVAGGTITSATWTGGAAFGTWTQNADPALATFTPTTTSGSFTATLTVTGSGACTGTNPADTRTITWGQSPTADAGADINRCDATPTAPIAMTGAAAGGTFTSATWTGGATFGTWTQNANPALATFTPTTSSGSFTATLTVTGSGACSGTNPTDTRTISWGQSPTADAGTDINRCDATPTAPVAMTGAVAGGTFTSATWTGGAAFGSWTQNADPALATFTPTTTSGSFTATLTVTGGGTCIGTNPTDTRTITWGQSPTADAGADINRCDATPTAPIAMTGAAAGGTITSATWTGGAAFGTWTQNADPALTIFTPVTNSGSFTATLTVTGSGACTGTNPADTRIISWGESPSADAGADINRCDATPTAPIAMNGAAAGGSFSSATWTGGAAFGTWTQNADPALATFTPTTTSGSFTATLTVTGSGACTGTNPTDTRTITWGQSPTANAGSDIDRCDANPAAPITMTGASAVGTYTSAVWTGGVAFGTWTQNADPALATFTPTTTSGSFTATLTVTGSGACTGTNPTDTKTISWGQSPTTDAGTDINRCDATPTAPIIMTGAVAGGTITSATWTGGAGFGTWTQNADPALATFTPTTTSGSFTATLTVTGSGACTGTNPTDTRTISWGQSPTADAGADINRCDATPTAPILMTGSVAGGTFSSANWSGGSGLGTWTQNANPALATFTPTVTSGSFTAVLTLTGTSGCSGTNVTDTRTISWGMTPSLDAGSDIDRCDLDPTDPVAMSGAMVSGTISSAIWSGGEAFGTWTQNADPALATFTPSSNSGSFTANLTIEGSYGCEGVISADSREIAWNKAPEANAGTDMTICNGEDIQLNGSASDYGIIFWSTVTGDGYFDNEFILDPVYTPGTNDIAAGTVTLYLTATGTGSCGDVTDSIVITIPPKLIATIGKPTPFLIGPDTKIQVTVKVEDHFAIHDLSYYLQAPDGTRVPLKVSDNFLTCNWGDEADLVFTNNSADDTLDICTSPFFPGSPVIGTYRATGDFSTLFGMDPANGAWSVVIVDGDYNILGPSDGFLTEAGISFTDTAWNGFLETVAYTSGVINEPILQNPVSGNGETSYISPLGLRTNCYEGCDAIGLVTVVGGTPPYVDYQWTPLPTGGNGTDSVTLCAGNYTLTVTDALGCTYTTTVEVTSPPQIQINSLSYTDSMICSSTNNGVIACKATGGTGTLTYTLMPGNIPSAIADSGRWENLSGGNYTIIIKDINECIIDSVISIYQPETLGFDNIITSPVTCSGDADGSIIATAVGGKEPYTYWITPGTEVNNDGIFENLTGGFYQIWVTDANSCDTIPSGIFNVSSPAPLNIDTVLMDSIACAGENGRIAVVVSGGTLPYYISLTGGADSVETYSDTTYFDVPSGIYNIVAVDSNGCDYLWTNPVNLTDPLPITVDSLHVTNVTGCNGDMTGAIYIEASGGRGTITYSLDGGLPQTENEFSNLPAGDHILLIEDGFCSVLDTVSITQPSPITIQVTDTKISDEYWNITVNATGGTPPYTYLLDSGLPQISNEFDSITEGYHTIIVTDDQGCSESETFSVNNPPLEITIHDTVDASCYGYSDGGFFVEIENGTPPYDIIIVRLPGDTLRYSGNPWNTNFFNMLNSLRAGLYEVEINEMNGLSPKHFLDTFEIAEPSQIIVNVGASDASCSNTNDGSITLSASGGAGGYTYSWNDDVTITTASRNNLSAGTYRYTVTDADLCPVSGNINVYADYTIGSVDAGKDTIICPFTEVTLHGAYSLANYDSIRWYLNLLPGEQNYIKNSDDFDPVLSTFTYTEPVLAVYDEGCIATDTVVIEVHPAVEFTLYEDEVTQTPVDPVEYLNEGDEYGFSIVPETYQFRWMPSEGMNITNGIGSVSLIGDSTTYFIIGESEFGCLDTAMFTAILVRDIKVYSGFSPNGDTYNDYWIIDHAMEHGTNIEVMVFNRWGERVFYSKGYSSPWDGSFMNDGKPLPIGTYYYIIKVNDGKSKPYTGSVTILK